MQARSLDSRTPHLFYNNQLIFFRYNSTQVYFFDFKEKKFIPGLNLSRQLLLSYFRAVQLPDSSVLLTGGSDAGEVIFDTVFHYLTDGTIVTKRRMCESRRAHSAIYNSFTNSVYVFGGVSNKGFLDSCEKYNPHYDSWSKVGNMSKKRTLTSCCNINKDSIFVFGGFSEDEQKELDLIERYDIIRDKFFTISYKMPFPLQNPFTIQINEHQVLLLGGFSDEKGDFNGVGLLDIYKGDYKAVSPLSEGGWSVYPPVMSGNSLCLFMDGEELEEGNFPTFIEYKI